MQQKVWNYIKKNHMIENGDRIVVGVSGGADSVALICLLESYRTQVPFELCVVHVNHNLRGEEALRDQEYVRNLCKEKQIRFALYSVDVKQLANQDRLTTEEAGRQARQEAFRCEMEKWNGTKIALAHHKNDLAETIVHHLCRGTGIKGLCGILPVQGEKIRPLLCLERREIEAYLKSEGISWMQDSSNQSDDYTRNRIRHKILPVMEEEINSASVAHMAETAGQLLEIEEYLSGQGRLVLDRYQNGCRLNEDFFLEPYVLQKYAIMEMIGRICHSKKDLTARQINRVLELGKAQVGKQVELPGNFRAVREYKGICLEEKISHLQKKNLQENLGWERKLQLQKETFFPGGKMSIQILQDFSGNIPEKTYTKWLSYDKIKCVPVVRTRRKGDFLVVNQQGGRKKLKDYFIDCKIPKEKRDQIPLVAIGSEILWVVGYRISEAYKVGEDTETIIEIRYKGE